MVESARLESYSSKQVRPVFHRGKCYGVSRKFTTFYQSVVKSAVDGCKVVRKVSFCQRPKR